MGSFLSKKLQSTANYVSPNFSEKSYNWYTSIKPIVNNYVSPTFLERSHNWYTSIKTGLHSIGSYTREQWITTQCFLSPQYLQTHPYEKLLIKLKYAYACRPIRMQTGPYSLADRFHISNERWMSLVEYVRERRLECFPKLPKGQTFFTTMNPGGDFAYHEGLLVNMLLKDIRKYDTLSIPRALGTKNPWPKEHFYKDFIYTPWPREYFDNDYIGVKMWPKLDYNHYSSILDDCYYVEAFIDFASSPAAILLCSIITIQCLLIRLSKKKLNE